MCTFLSDPLNFHLFLKLTSYCPAHLAGETQFSCEQERILQVLASLESPKNKLWTGVPGKSGWMIEVPAAAISKSAFTAEVLHRMILMSCWAYTEFLPELWESHSWELTPQLLPYRCLTTILGFKLKGFVSSLRAYI